MPQEETQEIKIPDNQDDKNIEFHKNANIYAEQFDTLCKEGKFHMIESLLNKFPGMPINGFCYICMYGNKELAERLWNLFKHTPSDMYNLCCIQHIYTEVMIKNKFNVADWIYDILKQGINDHVDNVRHHQYLKDLLEYSMYYVFYYSNLSICEAILLHLLEEYKISHEELKSENDSSKVKNIINNCFLFACRANKIHNAQYLIDAQLISKQTLQKYLSLYTNKNFQNTADLPSYECDYMDIDIKKIPHILYP